MQRIKGCSDIDWKRVPLLSGVRELVQQGHRTRIRTQLVRLRPLVDLGPYGQLEQALLTDPQTSGGLLVTCAPEAVQQVLALFRGRFEHAAVIGRSLRVRLA